MSSKIAKTIARQQERIAEGNYYEAHQQLRVITSRYLKSTDYKSAADVLYNGALLLLKAGQGGSGGDLSMMLLNDVYTKGEYECTEENKQRLLEILHAFQKDEPTRKRFVQEMINWSGKFGELERGDPELHNAVGKLYAEEGEAYDAERHLLIGTPSSAPILASLHYQWYTADSPHTAALYASRSVLPYLVLGNLASATTALAQFTSLLTSSNTSLPTQSIDSAKSSVRIFPSIPLLNFLALLLLSAQKNDAGLFRQLAKHYAGHLKEVEEFWGEALANVGEIWFNIRMPKQGGSNPLFDMMSNMMFGGGGGAAGQARGGTPRAATPKPAVQAKPPSAPAAMELD
ncbi:uncharacterized protein HMPREF1541_04779 [Cyphellophora europaea CBS 101466]|uniref:DUF410 domain-containing protein n=1 Tax=Cyphellophora europaea (strain CBS 101466) TaxID=1220924 RepID=W2RVN6_CYPE1|nr:uncharacterized protein HMPREF1541_04779 [Cyphellophora europaea CBS 101466]ETN40502.1 hypothetical protein HMPREF1541_04779 [Cyphellophora europaea CBS 101466]